jgi:hypothetical protein
MAGRLQNLSSWLLEAEASNLKIVLVHDVQDEETGNELEILVSKTRSVDVTLLSGFFGGPGAARNIGLSSVTTPWFAFWDSDDRPRVNAVLDMVSSADKSGKNLAIGEFQIRSAVSNKIESFSLTDGRKLISDIALNPGIWRMAFRTSNYVNFRFPNYRMGEDQCWLTNLIFDEDEVSLSHKIVYEYVVGNPFQLTSGSDSHIALTQTTNHLVKLLEESPPAGRELLSYLIMKQLFSFLKRGRIKSRVLAFFKIFQLAKVYPSPKLLIFIFRILASRKQLKKPHGVIMNGGLGNQFFQLSAGSAFANGTPLELIYLNRRRSKRSVREQSNFDLSMHPQYFCSYEDASFIRIKILNLGLRISSRKSFGPRGVPHLFNELLLLVIEFSHHIFGTRSQLKIAKGLGFSSNIKCPNRPTKLLGYFQSEKYASELDAPESLLRTSPDFADSVLPRAIVLASNSNPLIVHVRLGDYSENPYFGMLSKKYFDNVIEKALTESDCKEIWLFSNEIHKAREMISADFDLPVVEWALEGSTPSEVLKVMSLGGAYVISNSTFGWWSAYLACLRNPKTRVYHPDPWFKEIPTPASLFPSTWESKPAFFE